MIRPQIFDFQSCAWIRKGISLMGAFNEGFDEDFLSCYLPSIPVHNSLLPPPPPQPTFFHPWQSLSFFFFFNVACNLFITVLYLHSSLSRFSSARKTYPNHYIISNALVRTSNLELLKALFRRTDFYQSAGGVRMFKEQQKQQKLPWMALLYKNKWLHKNLDIYHLVNLSQWNNPSRGQMRKPCRDSYSLWVL